MFLFQAVLTAPLSVWKKTAADKWAYQTRHVFLFPLMRRRMHIENFLRNFRILFHFDSQFGRVSINEWFQFIPRAGKDIVVINWLDFFPVPLLQWWLVWIVSSINLLKTQNEPFRISPVGKDNQDIPILHQRQFEGNTILHGMSSFGLHSVMGKCPWFAGSQQIGVFSTNGSSSWSVRFQQGTAGSIPIRSGREILYLSLPPEILEVGLLLLLLLVGSNWCAFRRSSSWRWQFPALIS